MCDDTLRSRSWKVFPNSFVQDRFSIGFYNGLDGELILGEPTAKDVYRVTNSALQRHDGQPDVKFYVFDEFDNPQPFENRLANLIDFIGEEHIKVVDQKVINDVSELMWYESEILGQGFEGLMLRSPSGLYKHGRATTNSGELLKLKRFEDSEAEVIGIEEEMHNANEAKKNAFGRTERSSHKANLVGTGRMGALLVRDLVSGVEFSVGTGFDDGDREAKWKIGEIIKYKSFKIGVKDKPRHPVYLGRRMKEDM